MLQWMLKVALAVLLTAFLSLALVGCGSDDTDDHAGHPHAGGLDRHTSYANTKCPIMDQQINPATVTPDLTREFKNELVAFCCSGCPEAWDQLSENEKQAKLDAAR